MKVSELGEFGVIKLLTEIVTRGRTTPDNAMPHDFRLLVDAGDDTAAWRCGQGTQLFTTDTAVEGVHFTRATTSWRDVGWKIAAANVSDIAAMGGLPLYALVTLGLPLDTDIEEVDSLYRGMMEFGNQHGVAIVGGDIVRSPVVFVTVGLTGVGEENPMLRSSAETGDLIGVTGYIGSSAGGLEVLTKDLPVLGEATEYLKAAHRRPAARIAEGRVLCQHGVRTAIDISDGLVDDLSKVCEASGVASRLDADQVPVHPALKEVFPDRYTDMALSGGEDYQLLFTAREDLMGQVRSSLGSSATVVGEIVPGGSGQVTIVRSKTGEKLKAPRGGWDHFG